jgi:phenylalanine ammonia-lyase
VGIFQQYLAIGLLFGVQAVQLRTRIALGHYDARQALSPATQALYAAVHEAIGRASDVQKPLVWNDDEQALDAYIDAIAEDLRAGGKILGAVDDVRKALSQ